MLCPLFSSTHVLASDDHSPYLEYLALFGLTAAHSFISNHEPLLPSIHSPGNPLSIIDGLRGVAEETPLLVRIQRILYKFTSHYKSSESYLPRREYAHVTEQSLVEFVSGSRINGIKSILAIQFIRKDLVRATTIAMRIPEFANKTIDLKAIYYNIIELLGFGECGEQSHAMIIELMQVLVEEINLYVVVEGEYNHAFVTFTHEGIFYAIDPLFNILCPLDNYWEQEEFLAYFRAALSNPHWKPDLSKISTGKQENLQGVIIRGQFLLENYQPLLEQLIQQIEHTSAYFQEHPDMIKMKGKYQKIREASETYELLPELKEFLHLFYKGDIKSIKAYLTKNNIIMEALKIKTHQINPLLNWKSNLNKNAAWLLTSISDKKSLQEIADVLLKAGIKASLQQTKDKKQWCLMLEDIFY
jgi:hypothetical protein